MDLAEKYTRMTDPAELLPLALEAVDLAANLVLTRPVGALTAKGDRDYASDVDIAVERAVRAFLKEKEPTIGFVGEEEHPSTNGERFWWTLDPIDGTVNFSRRLPLCGVSLALVRGSRPVLGVIDLPFLSARYTAVDGEGAYRNDQRLHVSNVDKLSDALLALGDYAVGTESGDKNRLRLRVTEALASRVLRIRMLGSAAVDLAWLAQGSTDVSITLSNQSWDVAAGVVIAREAGADVIDYDGSDYTMDSTATIALAPRLRSDLLAALPDPREPT